MASDPTPLQNIREEGITAGIPTLPGPSGAANQANVTFHNLRNDELPSTPPTSFLPPSPNLARQRPRGWSSVSRVDIGHFDPTGVNELRQTMSRVSANTQGDDTKRVKKETSFRSDVTLQASDAPFDFEKCLRDLVKKYLPCFSLDGLFN
jgi:ATP-binding cassette subfamily G (WHITE) protein 2 (SNQ2)